MNGKTSTVDQPNLEAMAKSHHSSLTETCETECAEQKEDFQKLMDDVGSSLSEYCRRRPGVAACTVFALGFFFGWKIKPW